MSEFPRPRRYEGVAFRRCGWSGLVLPPISLGLWQNFGSSDDPDMARAIVRHAVDHGVTHFDLANNYGPPAGSAEETFGRLLATDLLPSDCLAQGWVPHGAGAVRRWRLAQISAVELGREPAPSSWMACCAASYRVSLMPRSTVCTARIPETVRHATSRCRRGHSSSAQARQSPSWSVPSNWILSMRWRWHCWPAALLNSLTIKALHLPSRGTPRCVLHGGPGFWTAAIRW